MTMRAFWDKMPCSLVTADRRFRGASIIILMMEAIRISETSVYSNRTKGVISQNALTFKQFHGSGKMRPVDCQLEHAAVHYSTYIQSLSSVIIYNWKLQFLLLP
jgi:hypothetical protein